MTYRLVPALLLQAMLCGCATYQPLPLPTESGLMSDVGLLADLLPGTQPVEVTDGVDMNELAIIAVVTNPDMIAARQRLNTAAAQFYTSRLLPDPQLGASRDRPTNNDSSLVDAFGISLNYDLLALITRSASIDSQAAATEQVRLEVVWQEWQIAQQARTLFVRERSEARKLERLVPLLASFENRETMSAKALSEGNLTIDSAGPDLTALLDIGSQVFQLRQQHNQTQHEMRALLGLAPDATLQLTELPAVATAPTVAAGTYLQGLANRRPDLLALQAGYASQEAQLRKSVLSLFPALSVGFARTGDTSGILTSGFGVSLDLPVFMANRGQVRIQRATRDQLRSEYQARLAQAGSDVSQLLGEQGILHARQRFLQAHLPQLERMAEEARRAYASRDIDALVFLNLEISFMNKQMELIDVEQALWEVAIALDTITARADAR
jgi:outer membrane protein TolC